jgi:hypothetical protein
VTTAVTAHGVIRVWLTLPADIRLGAEPAAVHGRHVHAWWSPADGTPRVIAHGYRVNVDGHVGRLWRGMSVPWDELPPPVRHRLARMIRDEARAAGQSVPPVIRVIA